MARRKAPRIPDALLDQLLAGADPKSAFNANGLLDELKKAFAERALNAEMDHHLASDEGSNSRNGYGRKTVTTDTGRIDLEIPRDRQSTFDPQLIAKYQRRFAGFDEKIVSMYARGMSVREIVGHLRELYGVDVSPDLISAVCQWRRYFPQKCREPRFIAAKFPSWAIRRSAMDAIGTSVLWRPPSPIARLRALQYKILRNVNTKVDLSQIISEGCALCRGD